MEYIYLILSLVGWVFFFIKKRKVDFMTVGFASQQIYFSPCFIQALGVHEGLMSNPLDSGVSIAGIFLVVLFLVFSIKIGASGRANKVEIADIRGYEYHAEVATFIAFIAFGVSLMQAGPVLFMGMKKDVLETIDRFYIVWTIASIYGFVVSCSLKKKVLACINILLLVVTVYVGFRSVAAIAAISFFSFMYSRRQSPVSLFLSDFKMVLFVLLVVVFFFVYKGLYIAVKLGNYDRVFDNLLLSDFYLRVFFESEPFIVQRTFSDVIVYDFKIGIENLGRIIYMFTVFSNEIGVDNKSFNAYFQPVLYGDVNYGMGSNVWAHVYSSGGWLLFVVFAILYVLSLRLASHLLYTVRPSLVPLLVVLSSYWSFYIHRNDLVYQIGLERRVIIVFFMVFLLAWLFRSLKRVYLRSNKCNC